MKYPILIDLILKNEQERYWIWPDEPKEEKYMKILLKIRKYHQLNITGGLPVDIINSLWKIFIKNRNSHIKILTIDIFKGIRKKFSFTFFQNLIEIVRHIKSIKIIYIFPRISLKKSKKFIKYVDDNQIILYNSNKKLF